MSPLGGALKPTYRPADCIIIKTTLFSELFISNSRCLSNHSSFPPSKFQRAVIATKSQYACSHVVHVTVLSRLCSWFRDEALNIPRSGLHQKIPLLRSQSTRSCHAMVVMKSTFLCRGPCVRCLACDRQGLYIFCCHWNVSVVQAILSEVTC